MKFVFMQNTVDGIEKLWSSIFWLGAISYRSEICIWCEIWRI